MSLRVIFGENCIEKSFLVKVVNIHHVRVLDTFSFTSLIENIRTDKG